MIRIESLLEESFNERMHLLTFLKMQQPGRFMRFMVLVAQGVWCNALFFAYLISPRTVHRFVGYLEEEAVITYTRQIKDIEEGKLPKWETLQAPEIAVDYWKMPEGRRSMRDLLLYIRADESKHREVNHTLGNLDQGRDQAPPTQGSQIPAPYRMGTQRYHLEQERPLFLSCLLGLSTVHTPLSCISTALRKTEIKIAPDTRAIRYTGWSI
jgi:hypothetical protein